MKKLLHDTDWVHLWEETEELCAEIGLSKGFLEGLYEQDDWSFLIKIHALIETTANVAIQRVVDAPKLSEFLLGLNLSGGRTSKLSLLEELDQITKEERKIVDGFGQIRNQIVHNIRHVDFSFVSYSKELAPAKRDSLHDKLFSFIARDSEPPRSVKEIEKIYMKDPKFILFLAALIPISYMSVRSGSIHTTRRHDTLRNKINALLAKED